MRNRVISVGLLCVVSACADDALDHIKKETLVIRTPHVEDAKCALIDKRGTRWMLRKSPGPVTVRAGNGPMTITCTKKNYEKTIISVEEEKVDLQNYPGFLEEVSGFVEDPYSNIITRYPDEILVWMKPLHWDSEDAERAWAYEKDIYEKQQEAKKQARLAEERRLKELEIQTRIKSQETMDQQRQHLFNSKWFRWLDDSNPKLHQNLNQPMYNTQEHIDKSAKDKPEPPSEPINWQSEDQRLRPPPAPDENDSSWKFWQSDWFKGLTTMQKRATKQYPTE
jgi:hypothetical protein